MQDAVAVRCFHILIHGQFDERVRLAPEVPARGFYTSRWVVADGEKTAIRKAFLSAERELHQWSEVRDGLVGVSMEAEEVGPGSWWRWLRGGGRGFAFSGEE
jgi:hypothetical protein